MTGVDAIKKMSDANHGNKIVMIHRSQIIPDENNDRDNWDHPDTIAHIESIAKSAAIQLTSGKYYGIRQPIIVTGSTREGKHIIIDGECRWRATESLPEELQELPCIVRNSDEKEKRLDHVSANGVRKDLTLSQLVKSINKDKSEFNLSTNEIINVHGLRNKQHLSKLMAFNKLTEQAKNIIDKYDIKDVNIIYDLKKLDELGEESLNKLDTKLSKDVPISSALKSLLPKETNKPETEESEGTEDQPTKKKVDSLNLSLHIDNAVELAKYLNIDNAELLPIKELQKSLVIAIQALDNKEE